MTKKHPDDIDRIWEVLKNWVSKHQILTPDEEFSRDGGILTADSKTAFVKMLGYILINPLRMKNWPMTTGIFGLALSFLLLSVDFRDKNLNGVLMLLTSILFIYLFMINDLFKIPVEITSSIFFLLVTLLLFVLDLISIYWSNPFNKGLPIDAIKWSFIGAIAAVFTLSLVDFIYKYFKNYIINLKKKIS